MRLERARGWLPGRADLLCDWPGERGSHGAEDAGNEAGDNCPLLKMIRDQAQFTQLTSHETSEHRNRNFNNGAGSSGADGAGTLYRSTGTGLTRAVAWYKVLEKTSRLHDIIQGYIVMTETSEEI